jgi:hypothetical protein
MTSLVALFCLIGAYKVPFNSEFIAMFSVLNSGVFCEKAADDAINMST